MVQNQAASKKQSFNTQLYRPDIEPVCLVSDRRARGAFVAMQHGLFQVPISVPGDLLGFPRSFEARFMDVLAQWFFARDTPGANPASVAVV